MQITRNIDWSNIDYEDWTNHGRNLIEDNCKHKDQDNQTGEGYDSETNMRYAGYCEKCSMDLTDYDPMMNYGYPLHNLPCEENILKVVKQTCLTVMEEESTGEVYLVLCGGGMDLSQSIALAYLLAGERIPDELCFGVCTQPCLSVGKKEYLMVMKAVKEELKDVQTRGQRRIKEINEIVKKYKASEKEKKVEK